MMQINPLYILPNFFTALSAFLGFLSIAHAASGRFENACWLIFCALIFDGLDGRVARLTGTTSKFGVEFDSLADVIAFGVAPAALLFMYLGIHFSKFGIVVSGLFVVMGAMRLARFNVAANSSDPNVFIGLPIPSAAVFVASWILIDVHYDLPQWFDIALLVMALCVSVLMVSNIRYPSFKHWADKGISLRTLIVFIVIVLVLLYLYTSLGIAILITGYILFGVLRAFYLILKHIWHSKRNG